MNAPPTWGAVLAPFGLGQLAGTGHDLGSVRASRGQHAVVAYQVETWRRHEGGEFFEQFLRRQQQLAGTVGPVSSQGEHQRFLIHEAQPAAGNGWLDHVAAEPLESTAIRRLDSGGCMQ